MWCISMQNIKVVSQKLSLQQRFSQRIQRTLPEILALLMSFSKSCFRGFIKNGLALGKPAPHITKKLKTVNLASSTYETMVFLWMKHFDVANSSIEDERGK